MMARADDNADRRAERLKQAGRDQHDNTVGDGAGKAGCNEKDKAADHDGLAAEAVGKAADKELGRREADKKDRHG